MGAGSVRVCSAQLLRHALHAAPGVVDETFDMERDVRKEVNDLPLADFFGYLAKFVETNLPTPDDAPIIGQMAEIGIAPGRAGNSTPASCLASDTGSIRSWRSLSWSAT